MTSALVGAGAFVFLCLLIRWCTDFKLPFDRFTVPLWSIIAAVSTAAHVTTIYNPNELPYKVWVALNLMCSLAGPQEFRALKGVWNFVPFGLVFISTLVACINAWFTLPLLLAVFLHGWNFYVRFLVEQRQSRQWSLPRNAALFAQQKTDRESVSSLRYTTTKFVDVLVTKIDHHRNRLFKLGQILKDKALFSSIKTRYSQFCKHIYCRATMHTAAKDHIMVATKEFSERTSCPLVRQNDVRASDHAISVISDFINFKAACHSVLFADSRKYANSFWGLGAEAPMFIYLVILFQGSWIWLAVLSFWLVRVFHLSFSIWLGVASGAHSWNSPDIVVAKRYSIKRWWLLETPIFISVCWTGCLVFCPFGFIFQFLHYCCSALPLIKVIFWVVTIIPKLIIWTSRLQNRATLQR